MITPEGMVTTVAGLAGSSGSIDGVASEARFSYPAGIAVDSTGIVYVVDNSSHTVRRIAPGGAVTTVAGLAGVRGEVDGFGSEARF
jgi:DNA-binding beta-propeller fold protein YncE